MLIWDEINAENYLESYCSHREICPESSPLQICFVPNGNECIPDMSTCVDIDINQYLIYRFKTTKEALRWGVDQDGDKWPDLQEDPNHNDIVDPGETDPCDPDSHHTCTGSLYTGAPCELVGIIKQNDPNHTLILDSGRKVKFFSDHDIKADDKVYWYRIQSEDPQGNRSILSPPIRAVLFDRTPPLVKAKLSRWRCEYFAEFLSVSECKRYYINGSILTLVNGTDQEKDYPYRIDIIEEGSKTQTIEGTIPAGVSSVALFPNDFYSPMGWIPYPDKIIVQFYESHGLIPIAEVTITANDVKGIFSQCSALGCIILKRECRYQSVGYGDIVQPEADLMLCVPLKEKECARVYHLIGGYYSPMGVEGGFCEDTAQTIDDSGFSCINDWTTQISGTLPDPVVQSVIFSPESFDTTLFTEILNLSLIDENVAIVPNELSGTLPATDLLEIPSGSLYSFNPAIFESTSATATNVAISISPSPGNYNYTIAVVINAYPASATIRYRFCNLPDDCPDDCEDSEVNPDWIEVNHNEEVLFIYKDTIFQVQAQLDSFPPIFSDCLLANYIINQPERIDTDTDGFPDAWEIAKGLDPLVNTSQMDSVRMILQSNLMIIWMIQGILSIQRPLTVIVMAGAILMKKS